jgi:hypothetical protein
VAARRTAALHYFNDGSVELAVPPLRALLHLMRDGTWEGRGPDDPAFRALFTRETLLASDWYRARLAAQQAIDLRLAERHARYLEKFLARASYTDVARRLDVSARLDAVIAAGREARAPAYLAQLSGTIGAEPSIAAALAQHPPA